MAKRTFKEFQEVSEVSNTSPNPRLWLFLETAILYFASRCSPVLIILSRTSHSSGCIFALCLCFRFCVSLLAFSSLLLSHWHRDNETT